MFNYPIFKLASPKNSIILASASPRRHQFLNDLGIPFTVEKAEISEIALPSEMPEVFVKRMAQEKAFTIAEQHNDQWIISADTIVTIEDEILGKPIDKNHALAMLMSLSGKTHHVLTGFCLLNKKNGFCHTEFSTTAVKFWSFTEDMALSYIKSGESMDKAGAYAIQGKGTFMVKSITGSYSNVVGLPVAELVNLLLDQEIIKPVN